jgi:hypothetical protein
MGGQACVFYGAAEFSRDLDLFILAESANLERLKEALSDLEAEPIAVPELTEAHLRRGHAVHFRCHRSDVEKLRIDLMAHLRGGPSFEDLWDRRTTIEVEGEPIDILALEDLVAAKKTQRDKDWPMISRLVERSWFSSKDQPSDKQIEFWLRELRTPELLLEIAELHPKAARSVAPLRPAIAAALGASAPAVEDALKEEEREERRNDREYWAPLKLELEQFRKQRISK